MRYVFCLAILITASSTCSRGPERTTAAVPTAPSAANATAAMTYVSGAAGPMDVSFPNRSETLQFRNDLESYYQSRLGRSATASSTYVDKEGEAIWTQEYIRYRANGCAHLEAIQRVMSQIDGNPPGMICQAPSEYLAVSYPSRADTADFRRQLETKYQQMGRSLMPTAVDAEGAAVWIQEYLRYRTNACGHAVAEQNVFTQIDGNSAPPTCFVACSYLLAPGGFDTGAGGSNQSFEVRPNPVACPWTAVSTQSWLTFPNDFRSGNGYTVFPYSVAANNGGDRRGEIVFTYPTGTATFVVTQAGNPFVAGFTMVDPARGPGNTNECHFRSTSTSCTISAFANLPGNTYSYIWNVSYLHGTQKTTTLTNSSPTLTFTDACGGPDSSPGGTTQDLHVSVTISDERGNSVTVASGGAQPAMFVRLFSCGA
jgi:hypothetical protein